MHPCVASSGFEFIIHTPPFFSSCSSSSYLLLRSMTMTLSPSLALTVRLNPSLSLSVYFSPSPMQHHSLSSGNELLCLLPPSPPSLSHSSSRLAIRAYLPPHPLLYFAGYIRSSVRCLGPWQPVSCSEWMMLMCACWFTIGGKKWKETCLSKFCWCLSHVFPCPGTFQ